MIKALTNVYAACQPACLDWSIRPLALADSRNLGHACSIPLRAPRLNIPGLKAVRAAAISPPQSWRGTSAPS